MKEGSGKGWKVCIAATFGIVITIVIIAVIMAFTVFKPQKLVTKIDSIEINDMDVGFNMFNMSLKLNVSFDVGVSVKNPNKFGLKYYDGLAQLNYRGQNIGEAPIPNGEILAEETKVVNATLTLMADRLLSNSQVISDVTSDKLPISLFMKIYGEVNILEIFKFNGNSTLSCDFDVIVSKKRIENNVCHSKTEV